MEKGGEQTINGTDYLVPTLQWKVVFSDECVCVADRRSICGRDGTKHHLLRTLTNTSDPSVPVESYL